MTQTWKSGSPDDYTCPYCGAIYAVTVWQFHARDSDSVDCIECDKTMASWNDTFAPSFTLKRRADGSDV
jgi:hypothetical protein